MRNSDQTDFKKFGKTECARSVAIFLFNYLVMLLLVALFMWLNSLYVEDSTLQDFFLERFNTIVYLMASIFMLKTGRCLPIRKTSG